MKKSPHRISTEMTSDKIKLVNDIDLNALFNLNYNFDLLKGIIETLLQNQGALQRQLDEMFTSNDEKDKIIEKMEEDIKILKDTKINRTDFKNLENEVKHIKDHLKQDDKKIGECKFILYLNNIYDNFFQFSFKTNQWNKRCFAEI